ncbi:MAG: hypothetical protein OXC46_00840 [Thaumarchaeota archaeon]|nr:hypothetical protein [Nitrososphaerota archaeon]
MSSEITQHSDNPNRHWKAEKLIFKFDVLKLKDMLENHTSTDDEILEQLTIAAESRTRYLKALKESGR